MNNINVDKAVEAAKNLLNDARFNIDKRLEHLACFLFCISRPILADQKHLAVYERNINKGVYENLNSISSEIISYINTSNFIEGSYTYFYIVRNVIVSFLETQGELNKDQVGVNGYLNYIQGVLMDVSKLAQDSSSVGVNRKRAFCGALGNIMIDLKKELA